MFIKSKYVELYLKKKILPRKSPCFDFFDGP